MRAVDEPSEVGVAVLEPLRLQTAPASGLVRVSCSGVDENQMVTKGGASRRMPVMIRWKTIGTWAVEASRQATVRHLAEHLQIDDSVTASAPW